MVKSQMLKIQIFYMVTVSSVALVSALIYTRPVLMPLTFAIFAYFASLPAVNFLENKLKAPRIVALALTGALASGVSIIAFLQISLSLKGIIPQLDMYRESFLSMADSITGLLETFGLKIDRLSLRELLASLPIKNQVTQFVGGTLGLLGNALLIFVIYGFLMLGRARSRDASPSLLQEVEAKVSRYVLLKLILSTLTGVLMAIILLGFRVDLAVLFGFLALVLNFIPSIGSIIATILPIPIIAMKYGLGGHLLLIVLLCTLVQIVIGSIIDPKMIGKDLDLHPIVIILSLVFWGIIWGLGGMFLAVPLTVTLKLALSRVEPIKDLGELLAGRLS